MNRLPTHNYRQIQEYKQNKLVLAPRELHTLRTKLFFTQLRFFCHKKIPGRTFDIATTTNNSGEQVIEYFTAQTNDRPKSCGSYYSLSDDNSTLAGKCAQWGGESAQWGPIPLSGSNSNKNRLMDHAAFVESQVHWLVYQPDNRWECDDYSGETVSSGDFWKIFVR